VKTNFPLRLASHCVEVFSITFPKTFCRHSPLSYVNQPQPPPPSTITRKVYSFCKQREWKFPKLQLLNPFRPLSGQPNRRQAPLSALKVPSLHSLGSSLGVSSLYADSSRGGRSQRRAHNKRIMIVNYIGKA